MPLRLKVESGGEHLLPFAKKKLRELKAEMNRLGVHFRTKWFDVSDSERIFMQSQMIASAVMGDSVSKPTFMDVILIYAGQLGGFVVYPRIRRIIDDVEFISPRPALLDLRGLKITRPFEDLTVVGPPYRNSGNRVLASAGSLYYDKGRRVESAAAADTMPFVHHYTVNDTAIKTVLLVEPHANNPEMQVASTATVLPISGSGQVHDISPDGRNMVSLVDDERVDFSVDLALDPAVTETPTTLDGYGTNTARFAVFATDNNMLGQAQFQLEEISESVSFPVCYGYNVGNERVSITWDESYRLDARWDLNTLRTITSPGEGFTNSDGSISYVSSRTVTLAMPGGVTKQLVVESESTTASGHYENTISGGNIITKSENSAGTATKQTIDLTILYADASLPALVYKAVHKSTTFSIGSPTSGAVAEPVDSEMTQYTEVIALVGGNEHVIYRSDPEVLANDVPINIYNNPVAGFYSYLIGSSDTTNVTAVDATTISPPAARQQSATLGISIKDAERLVWDYKIGDDEHIQGGVGNPRQALADYFGIVIPEDVDVLPTDAEIAAYIAANYEHLRPTLLGLGYTNEQIDELFTIIAIIELGSEAQLSPEEKAEFLADLQSGNLSGYDVSMSHPTAPGIGLV